MLSKIDPKILALAASVAWVSPASAQDAAPVQQELDTMRAELARMTQRIAQLEQQLHTLQADQASSAAPAATAAAAAGAPAEPRAEIAWKGAPVIEGKGGWTFKPRGLVQFDAGIVDTPGSTGRPDGFGSEARRGRLGVEGDIPGGFGYKFELDFVGSEVAVQDAMITYKDGPVQLSIGHQNPFQGLDELTSNRFVSMMERAAFTDAFGFERRLGISAQYETGPFLVQAGAFSDNLSDLSNKSWSVDGRAVYMPKFGDTQLHLGGSLHYSKLNDAANVARFRQRPFLHFSDQRFIDTGAFSARDETGIGLEAAAISGRFHAAAEGYWQTVGRPAGAADPTFFGGYAEIGYFLTAGDSRGYGHGIFQRVKPARPLGDGGPGAVQVNLRYDHLDLSDAGIVGGRQRGYEVSLVWTPVDYVRFMVNYARLAYAGAIYPASGGDKSYGANALGMRAQLDF